MIDEKIFKWEGKEYKFRTLVVEDLCNYVEIFDTSLSTIMKNLNEEEVSKNGIPLDLQKKQFIWVSKFAKFLEEINLDKIKFSQWKPLEFIPMINSLQQFLQYELMGAIKPEEEIEIESEESLKKKLMMAQQEFQTHTNSL